jgi:hypothetical protein
MKLFATAKADMYISGVGSLANAALNKECVMTTKIDVMAKGIKNFSVEILKFYSLNLCPALYFVSLQLVICIHSQKKYVENSSTFIAYPREY